MCWLGIFQSSTIAGWDGKDMQLPWHPRWREGSRPRGGCSGPNQGLIAQAAESECSTLELGKRQPDVMVELEREPNQGTGGRD